MLMLSQVSVNGTILVVIASLVSCILTTVDLRFELIPLSLILFTMITAYSVSSVTLMTQILAIMDKR